MRVKGLFATMLLITLFVTQSGCKGASGSATSNKTALPVDLAIVTGGEVHETPEASDSWLIYVNLPLEDAHNRLKEQMESDGGWEARSASTYRKTIGGQSYSISITKGKVPVRNEPDDKSLWSSWTTFFLRKQ
jgi:hypothetical protein